MCVRSTMRRVRFFRFVLIRKVFSKARHKRPSRCSSRFILRVYHSDNRFLKRTRRELSKQEQQIGTVAKKFVRAGTDLGGEPGGGGIPEIELTRMPRHHGGKGKLLRVKFEVKVTPPGLPTTGRPLPGLPYPNMAGVYFCVPLTQKSLPSLDSLFVCKGIAS